MVGEFAEDEEAAAPRLSPPHRFAGTEVDQRGSTTRWKGITNIFLNSF